jgi:hypothetical protein
MACDLSRAATVSGCAQCPPSILNVRSAVKGQLGSTGSLCGWVLAARPRPARREARRMGHVKIQADRSFLLPRDLVGILVRPGGRAGRAGDGESARPGLLRPAKTGEYVSGTLAWATNLAGGRYAMIETGSGSASCGGSRPSTSASADTLPASCAATAASEGGFGQEARAGAVTTLNDQHSTSSIDRQIVGRDRRAYMVVGNVTWGRLVPLHSDFDRLNAGSK